MSRQHLLERGRRELHAVHRPGREQRLRRRHADEPAELLVRIGLLLGRADALVPRSAVLRGRLDVERLWHLAVRQLHCLRGGLGRRERRRVH